MSQRTKWAQLIEPGKIARKFSDPEGLIEIPAFVDGKVNFLWTHAPYQLIDGKVVNCAEERHRRAQTLP